MMKRKVLVLVFVLVVMVVLEALSFWRSWSSAFSYGVLGAACIYFFLCAWKKTSTVKTERKGKSRLWLLFLIVGIVGEGLIGFYSFINEKSILSATKAAVIFACLLVVFFFTICTIKKIINHRKLRKTKQQEQHEIKAKGGAQLQPDCKNKEKAFYVTHQEIKALYEQDLWK